MKHLIIIGARGFGRETYNLFLDCRAKYPDLVCKGFLDSEIHALDGYEGYPPIISSVEAYEPDIDDVFVCALGDPKWKKYYVEIMLDKGAEFISLIHPTVNEWQNSRIGKGCIINNLCHISCDVTIGNFVTILTGAVLGHDSSVGDWSHLGATSFLGGFSQIKEVVTLHTGAIVLPHKIVNDEAIVGAQSVVIRNVPSCVTVHGNPAVKIKF